MRRWFAVLAVAVFFALTYSYWLGTLGSLLVNAEAPQKADAIIVLAGDSDGNRILKAGELGMAGYAPVVYASGPREMYGVSEATLAINFAVNHGQPAGLFQAMEAASNSTEEEAAAITPILRARGVKTLLVVTSDYHTARAGRIWRRVASGMQIHMVAARDSFFTADGWWKNRTGRKTAFMEWTKTLTGPLGF